jgi:hypothetical protein
MSMHIFLQSHALKWWNLSSWMKSDMVGADLWRANIGDMKIDCGVDTTNTK